MAVENVASGRTSSEWKATQVFVLALVSLMIGLAAGYLFRGSSSPAPTSNAVQGVSTPGATAQAGMGAHPGMPNQPVTLDQLKRMADKQAEPLLAKLKDDPKNADLLIKIGGIYSSTHQFKEAADYFGKSLELNPKNLPIRTLMASNLYYSGDVDGALKQLEVATTQDPKDANSLFNLGFIRWQGKKDTKGALAAWTKLLKTNPQLEPARKTQVEKLISEVRQGNATN